MSAQLIYSISLSANGIILFYDVLFLLYKIVGLLYEEQQIFHILINPYTKQITALKNPLTILRHLIQHYIQYFRHRCNDDTSLCKNAVSSTVIVDYMQHQACKLGKDAYSLSLSQRISYICCGTTRRIFLSIFFPFTIHMLQYSPLSVKSTGFGQFFLQQLIFGNFSAPTKELL